MFCSQLLSGGIKASTWNVTAPKIMLSSSSDLLYILLDGRECGPLCLTRPSWSGIGGVLTVVRGGVGT